MSQHWWSGKVVGWSLLVTALALASGCGERHEQANPFIGPFGDAEAGSFGWRAPARLPNSDRRLGVGDERSLLSSFLSSG